MPESPPVLLIAWHSRTGAAQQMAQAAAHGARRVAHEMQAALAVRMCEAQRLSAPDVRAASGYLFCAPENLGTVSGEMKAFFDRNYYAVLDELAGRPYGLMIAAGTDGTGAQRQIERIVTGWRLQAVAPAIVARNGAQTPEAILAPKRITPEVRAQCEELGGLLAGVLLLQS